MQVVVNIVCNTRYSFCISNRVHFGQECGKPLFGAHVVFIGLVGNRELVGELTVFYYGILNIVFYPGVFERAWR